MQEQPFVHVLGSADWLPTPDNDGSCYTLDDRILIDTGWSAVVNMINRGMEPLEMDTVLFTHMHADHYMALPQILLYWRIRRNSLRELTIIGPQQSVQASFERAYTYVFLDSKDAKPEVLGMPRVIPLKDGDMLALKDYDLAVCASDHAAPGLCYRMTHRATGHAIGFSGDTAYRPEYGAFYQGCDLLVHEASAGDHEIKPPNPSRHSNGADAARVAKEAGVKSLLLTHAPPANREGGLRLAREALDIPVAWATPGRRYYF